MIVRFSVANFLSFRDLTDFNMVTGDVRTKKNHVKSVNGIEILKFSLLYGPNGAGKSNLIRSIEILREMVVKTEKVPSNILHDTHKFDLEAMNKPTSFEIEFVCNSNLAYIYGVEFKDGHISSEYLYQSGFGKSKDRMVFERTAVDKTKSTFALDKKFVKSKKDKDFIELFGSSIINNTEIALPRFLDFDERLIDFNLLIEEVYEWFVDNLRVIHPDSKPVAFLYHLVNQKEFLAFSNDLLEKLDLGIKKLHIQDFELREFLGKDSEEQIKEIIEVVDESDFARLDTDVIAVKNDKKEGEYLIKKLFSEHKGKYEGILFSYYEESDGTQRLIEYLTLIYEILNPDTTGVWLVDEIERSIHPHLLKELIKKLVNSENITGQLIFTTHESNLMDLELFRQDEIWLTEKDSFGGTSFSPLSDFKIRNDLDIQKGYLKGRFGAIPFLGNLEELNWYKYAAN